MENKAMQGMRVFTVDLRKISGKGDFNCPKCGVKISPDDASENVYTVLESIPKEGGRLAKVILQCNACKSQIHLTGFDMLNMLE